MLNKLTDTANILKAKITKDQLQQKLVQATSQENWQTPTNILHEIANAAYNYEKWQKINDFIWDKLKKKSSWRKVMKSLNLVEFLLKNGPPSTISSFKYDIYQFRSFSDYQAYHDGIDRGQAIRQKAKQIVDLLSNQQLLEEERDKAKKIRERMSGVTGGSTYGQGANTYGSYNNKSYGEKGSNMNYGSSGQGGLGVYGDYSYGKSTLDKYKADNKNTTTSTTTGTAAKKTNIPDITGTGTTAVQQQTKKPFEKIAPKLIKPSSQKQAPSIIPTTATTVTSNQAAQQNTTAKNNADFDLFDLAGPTTTATTTTTNTNTNTGQSHQTNNNLGTDFGLTSITTNNNGQNVQTAQVAQQAGQNSGLLYANTQPQLNLNQMYPPQQPQTQPFNLNQAYGQPAFGQPAYNQPAYGQPAYGQPGYGQPAYNQPSLGQPTAFGQPTYNQPMQFQPYNQPYGQQAPLQNPTYPQQYSQPQPQLSLSSPQVSLGSSSTGQTSASNVNWLSNNEKGLIDFSDFSKQVKTNQAKKQQKGNNISIDNWAW